MTNRVGTARRRRGIETVCVLVVGLAVALAAIPVQEAAAQGAVDQEAAAQGAAEQGAAAQGADAHESGPPRALESDTTITTPSGATFEAAQGWFVQMRNGRVVLQDPDRELTLTLLERSAENGAAAIAQAWEDVDPGFSRTARHTIEPPAREGWDAIVQIVYETATEEERTVMGVARRKGETWYVALLDAADAVLDRRGAQLQTALSSFTAPGVEEESWQGRTAATLDADRLAAFADFVEEALAATEVPGAAIAIVQDGRVVFERGFGVREQGKSQPVRPGSLFLIGSTTKSLTTLMMAVLVAEGRLAWDRPVVEIYPEFALADPELTPQVLLRHTVCACTGLPRQDMEFLFEFGEATAEDMVERMSTMTPTTGFGETFQYSNPMVSTGGYVAAHAVAPDRPLGDAYDAVMSERVLGPLGLEATTFDFSAALAGEHATPHGMDLRLEMAPMDIAIERALVPVRPAGGAWSSARDMARYIQLELSGGIVPGGGRLLSEEALLYRREPQVKISEDQSYGLGLFVEENRGVAIVHHGGNTLGFTSDLFFLPEHGVGAVVLTNAGGANGFRGAVRKRLLEILFDGREEARENLAFGLRQRDEVYGKLMEEVEPDPGAAWSDSLVGIYENASLGRIEVRPGSGPAGGGALVFDAGEWESSAARRVGPDGVAKLILTSAPFAGIDLLPGEDGGRRTLTLDLAQQRYVFERRL